MAWGGPEEQAQDIAAGNKNAINWHDEALQVVERTMQEYWDEATLGTSIDGATLVSDSTALTEDASKHANRNTSMGWAAELCCYLTELLDNVSKDMDVVSWWSKHASIYPTLSRIAQDVCAIPASLVPCERLFSAGAEIATDRRSRLGSIWFEELQVLKHAWRNSVVSLATINSQDIQEVYLQEYCELYELEEERGDVVGRGTDIVEER
ncbi:hypothetical protein SCLCIDRAFT_134329 [Scleroderma citrinum Foug A]|uniref:HAT C-terminal dimerisation domain-containing protein n=1 Tax=Scleroderma citrinum Foug A TaxID=1036808 RepID=A0A0C3D4A3_9AGAM|nr:hypothetical protein SCLCIDRAFT_134329 [Scleroderma citrinum Foug A]